MGEIHLRTSPEMDVLINSLLKDANYESRDELIRASLLTFRWVVDQYLAGKVLIPEDLDAFPSPKPKLRLIKKSTE